jgi:hypothetical protein
MRILLALARAIDALNERIGRFMLWIILLCTVISAANAVARYGFNWSSNAFLEIQWYLYSLVFLGAAGYTLKHNAHVRIDLVAGRLSRRTQAWIDVFGGLFMLLPVCVIIVWFGWMRRGVLPLHGRPAMLADCPLADQVPRASRVRTAHPAEARRNRQTGGLSAQHDSRSWRCAWRPAANSDQRHAALQEG